MTLNDLIIKKQKVVERKLAKERAIAKKQSAINSGKKDTLEIEWLNDDISKIKGEIARLDAIIADYDEKLLAKAYLEIIWEDHIPSILKDLYQNQADSWTAHDIAIKSEYLDKLAIIKADNTIDQDTSINQLNASYPKYVHTSLINLEDSEIAANNLINSKNNVINVFTRVLEIVGENANWDNLTLDKLSINGVVTGNSGAARLESRSAGGYNVQQSHNRIIITRENIKNE